MALNEITEAIDIAQKRAALKAELETLEKQEEEAKGRAHADAVAQTQALIDHFDIAPDEVTFTAKRILPPRFLNPETGETWHGWGKRPESFKGKDLEAYRIKSELPHEMAGKKSGTKTGKQAKSKTTQPVAEHTEASDVMAAAPDISITAELEVASTAPTATEPEDIAPVSELTQQTISVQGRQPAVNYGSSLMATGVRSYVNAVRAS
ncbi:H-NS histone family protein [Ralstonia solanacearum]|uniref:H-NS histone family protein n=1 Tax=Ralstonia solanacearum TaxID=305 RepID=UPI002366A826|nr:H-NS histone family protein [Ralstonia solanacearum]MDD7803734.1 H-NS histone family protein [Ralstonia solanacearum]